MNFRIRNSIFTKFLYFAPRLIFRRGGKCRLKSALSQFVKHIVNINNLLLMTIFDVFEFEGLTFKVNNSTEIQSFIDFDRFRQLLINT